MNFHWNATLFSERGQTFFMSLGRGWSKLSIKVIITSFPFRRFRSLPLILLFWYKSKNISSRLQELEMDRNVFHNVFTKSRKVFRFCVLTGTFLAYPKHVVIFQILTSIVSQIFLLEHSLHFARISQSLYSNLA